MTAFVHHFSFVFRTGIRNTQSLLMNYLFPLGFFLMMAAIMPAINPEFLNDLIPSMVAFAIIAATFLGLPDPLVKAREDGIFRSYKINGVPAASILSIPALSTMIHMVIVTAVITVVGALVFGAATPASWPYFALTVVALAAASVGLSVLIGVISPSTRMTILWAQVVFVPSMLLGGLMLPYDLLPEAAGKISQLLPASHAMNAFKALAMGGEAGFNPTGSLIVLFASGVLGFGLALYMFNWDRQSGAQRGHPLMALLVLIPFVIGIFVL
jgi:ABC-2 type transport system permease protein